MTTALPEALHAHRESIDTAAAGRVSYYSDTAVSGRPLLLLHSVNAAPSALEVGPLFDHYRSRRPVYALELPGFGFSDRPDIDYSPGLYAEALLEAVDELFDQPVDVVALSTTSEFIARAALSSPGRFNSLVLISPTGMGSREPPSGAASDRLRKLFSIPVFSEGLYRVLTTRASIRYFLAKAFEAGPPVELVDQAWATARQPGAPNAPFCFLAMRLFTPRACKKLYEPLAAPTLVLYDRDPNINFEKLPDLLEKNSRIQAARITPTLGMPHWEQLETTVKNMESFWKKQAVDQRGAA